MIKLVLPDNNYRDVEELPSTWGVVVDYTTIQRWVFKFSPLVEVGLKKRRKPAGNSWWMDETYNKVKGSGRTCTGL